MLIDEQGYRQNIGIVLIDGAGHVFWGRRIGHDSWQFPQGGVDEGETPEEALFRELKEEIGLDPEDVELLGQTKGWLKYRLPQQFVRKETNNKIVGQKQKWFLLRLITSEQKIRLDYSRTPEFDSWRWVDYWHPAKEIIFFKKQVYRQALKTFEKIALNISSSC